MKKMMLYASTNKVGSECSTDLDVTEEEFNAMTEEEKIKLSALIIAGLALEGEHGNLKPSGAISMDIGDGLIVKFDCKVIGYPFPKVN